MWDGGEGGREGFCGVLVVLLAFNVAFLSYLTLQQIQKVVRDITQGKIFFFATNIMKKCPYTLYLPCFFTLLHMIHNIYHCIHNVITQTMYTKPLFTAHHYPNPAAH